MRDYSITKKEGEWYNAKVTDVFGVEHQNYYETESECIKWVYYMWETELPPLTPKEEQDLLSRAIHHCKELDIKRGLRAIL